MKEHMVKGCMYIYRPINYYNITADIYRHAEHNTQYNRYINPSHTHSKVQQHITE